MLDGNKPTIPEKCQDSVMQWLAVADEELIEISRSVELSRPDKLAPVGKHIAYLGQISCVTGKREIIHELMAKLQAETN